MPSKTDLTRRPALVLAGAGAAGVSRGAVSACPAIAQGLPVRWSKPAPPHTGTYAALGKNIDYALLLASSWPAKGWMFGGRAVEYGGGGRSRWEPSRRRPTT